MASGPAASKVAEPNDWQSVEANDWQDVNATAPPTQPKPGMLGNLQKTFDQSTAPASPQERKDVTSLGLPDWANEVGDASTGFINGLGSLAVHPWESAKGIGNAIIHPKDTAEAAGKSFEMHPGYTVGQTLGMGVAGVGAGGAIKGAAEMIPSKTRAGATLQSVAADAGSRPVNLTRSLPYLERAQQLSERGHGTVTPLDNLYRRINTVNPLDFNEARDRYSALSNLTANDKMNATRTLQGQAKQFTHAFNKDIGDTAASVGRGEDFNKGMREYRMASKLGDIGGRIKEWAIPAAAGAAGLGAVHKVAQMVGGNR